MEQSSAPWRVFDAHAGIAHGQPGQPGAGQASLAACAGAPDRRLVVAGFLGAVVIAVLAVLVAVSEAGSETIEGPGVSGGAIVSEGSGSTLGEIVVDVAGAVVEPGVYRLAIGSRVGDAIAAAGGFSPRVDVDRVGVELNLAATLADGTQIRVPSRDEPRPRDERADDSRGGGGAGGSTGQEVNLNTASRSELESLPGIGPVTAGKIIESRAGSPFTRIDELRERGLVGEKTFESIRALVSVG